MEGKDFTVNKFGDELVISLGNQRRAIPLPKFTNYLQLKGYQFNAPWLEVALAH